MNKPIKKKARNSDYPSIEDDDIDNGRSGVLYENMGESSYEITQQVIENLPMNKEIDGIRLISLGNIDTRPQFHTLVQVYPVGYKAEVISNRLASKNKSHEKLILLCEINEKNELPEFVISIKSTGKVFRGTSEAAVWNKVALYVFKIK